MAYHFNVSLPETEKELWNWAQEKINRKELSPSLILRDAIKELKRQDDALHSENPRVLHERISNLKEVLSSFNAFVDKKGLRADWFDFKEKQDKQKFIERPVETIIEDHSKEVPLEVAA